MNYVSAKEARQILKISPATLKNYKDQGKIDCKIITPQKILYDIDSIIVSETKERANVIYARVSTPNQKQDLNNQIELLKSYCIANGIKPDKIYSDIASGLNENRKDLNLLIDDIIANKVSKVYITFKDRLTRFGFDYFQNFFSKFNTEIVVIDNFENSNKTFEDELTRDLISIIHHYSTKLYSNRRKKFKEIEKNLQDLDK